MFLTNFYALISSVEWSDFYTDTEGLAMSFIYNFRQFIYNYKRNYTNARGPGSSDGIATGYGLDGPGIESRWRRDFPHLSRPALGPTQPPVQ